VLPREKKSITDRENREPILAIPRTASEEPIREKHLSDNVDPMLELS
jgi:hypothetical protein